MGLIEGTFCILCLFNVFLSFISIEAADGGGSPDENDTSKRETNRKRAGCLCF